MPCLVSQLTPLSELLGLYHLHTGHTLIGVFMRNWDSVNEVGECSADEDYRRVQEVCRSLDIPCRRVDFVKEYWNDVFR